ncbi:AGE family epimerase/isomerase [Joostella sp.]|uniref:AGE family epimerase/isomerase n=1 Tax=Joostella sp. TaxID=2231138 RepID=UPI003A95A439
MNYSKLYKDTLLNDIVPFWEKNSIDHKHGGYYTCLDRTGNVYDTDKFMWLQGRQSWTFAMLYNKVDDNDKWLKIAKHGVDFILKYGMDENNDFYFSTTHDGKPLIQPYNIFSDCFAAMAFSQYSKASGEFNIRELAKNTYNKILKKKDNPKGVYEKSTGERPLIGFALPMILSNLVLELEDVIDEEEVNLTLDECIQQVMDVFLDKESGLIYENVRPNGTHEDSYSGRLLNPGHGIEAMWFMIDIGVKRKDNALIKKATDTILKILEHSWDPIYGGIFYFMDAQEKPPLELAWDQKLWWVHLETLVALAKAYECTGRQELMDWYEIVHNYSWSHFSDPINGEWYGYLNRRGEVLIDLKGGKWKGCFHVPRAMFQCWKSFGKIESLEL